MDFNDLATTRLTRKDVDFVCDHDTGKVWILHGKPFPIQKKMAAARFDRQANRVTLSAHDGETYTIDIEIKPPLLTPFAAAQSVTVVWTDKGEIFDIHALPLTAA